ncbi:MAG TPA: LysM peptidoglycan-binding domain-containing protein [Anaerolineae bacterium]|nr:LysM peptidoglycan-binding domain-containing protein [Anaerolineae bacterium]
MPVEKKMKISETEEAQGVWARGHGAAVREVAAASQTYVVKAGDSLSKIAKELLGDANRWKEIYEANQDTIKDPNVLSVGQKLVIPA